MADKKQKSILLTNYFLEIAHGKPSVSDPSRSLAYLLREGFQNAFEEGRNSYEFETLHCAFYVMYICEIITAKTYRTLLALVRRPRRFPWEYYEDGSIRYAFSLTDIQSLDDDPEKEGCSEIYDPSKVISWVFGVLAKDPMIRNHLCMDSYDDMISSATGFCIDALTARACLENEDDGIDACLCGGKYFHFKEKGDQLDLYVHDRLVRTDMAGRILKHENDLYFKLEEDSSYLHVNVASGKQELCHDINILGFSPEGCLVYVDNSAGKICIEDAKGKEAVLCDDKDDLRYEVGEHLLVMDFEKTLDAPYRVTYRGKVEKASPEEYAKAFWLYFIRFYSRKLAASRNIQEALTSWRFKQLTEGKRLTLATVLETLLFVRDNKRWEYGPAFPLINSVLLLQKKGLDPNDDITKELYSIVKYNELINIKSAQRITAEFYDVFCKLSKREDFLELLRDNPGKLFENHIVSKAARKKYDDWMAGEREKYWGKRGPAR